jgi:uncharacterized protein
MGCTYCYESTARKHNKDAGEQDGYNVDKIIDFIDNLPSGEQKDAPNLHGGEPLLTPKEENEKLFKAIFEKFGATSIQTNGTLIDQDYIDMFKKYNTNVGVSFDGTGELNLGRWMGNEKNTLKTADKIMKNIKWMSDEGVNIGIIAVVSKKNASPDKIPMLKEFLLELKTLGITRGRLNLVQVDFKDLEPEFLLTDEEAKYFYEEMIDFLLDNDLAYAPFTDVMNGLMGYGHKTCVTTQCDPLHTLGEQPVYGDGTVGNCLRTAKDGVVFLAEKRPDGGGRVSNERYAILQQIPYEEGGCGGCRFWSICTAYCPGEAEDGDWRNRTQNCSRLLSLFEATESKIMKTMPMITPVSRLKIGSNEIDKLSKENKLHERVFQKMNEKGDVF